MSCLLVICLWLWFPPVGSAGETAAGDPRRGAALYSGTAFFSQGGAPCLACHGIAGAGLGMAGSASFGPDLTAMFDDFGAEGVAAVLADLAFPSMEPIYASRPLTAEEQADVGAFLAEVAGRTPLHAGGQVAGHVAIGVAALAGLLMLFGWGRLNGVRRPLVEGFGKGKGGAR